MTQVCCCSLAGTAACAQCPRNPGPRQEPWNQPFQPGWPPQTAPLQPAVPVQIRQDYEGLRDAHNQLCGDVQILRAELSVMKAEQEWMKKWVQDNFAAKPIKKETKKK
jgi:hypothetical protein